ncbi:MAG TPA: DUF6650 family protein [Candidatus Acidoferrales bacterium]|nr:DUF6650 family protein [Candidatus Acidoferrales bacterium]
MKLSFREIADRITGISTPIFGISWNPPVLDAQIAKRLITFLEDRRALYNPYELESPPHVIDSVRLIRERLTQDLEQLDRTSTLAESLAAMRAACRKFLDSIPNEHSRMYLGPSMVFFSGVGELRGVFGIYIARICVQYGIDVESDLAAILPGALHDAPDGRPVTRERRRKK